MRRMASLTVLVAAAALGCSGVTAPEDQIESVDLHFLGGAASTQVVIRAGASEQLVFEARNASGALVDGVRPIFRSNNSAVASVDANGKVSGVDAGTVRIFASVSRARGTLTDSVLVLVGKLVTTQ